MKKMSVKSVKRDASTSTLGHDEARKPLMAAYMFQRRVLLGCSVLMALSLIIWIIAIATDRWIIITGGGGIFIPETRRFFMASHSGLWRHCRETKTPNALPNSTVIRNFTSFAFTNVGLVNNAKMNMSHMEFIDDFRYENVTFPLKNFTQEAKKRMFAHWIRNDEPEFQTLKAAFQSLELSSEKSRKALNPSSAKPIAINPLDIQNAKERKTFGNALQEVVVNSTNYNFVIPESGQAAIFENWNKIDQVLNLLWAYFRDLGIPPYVLNENGVVLQLVPPIPPKKQRLAYGYDYVPSSKLNVIQ
ncbi:uncharacterized protein LOC119674678, partial [Teleopsis dalmanni]|uniref:uncharacterized protein LOC119674678 n=1 Tax=Teleopsis dalmanni TaxID=139649 RepID=UPI0018CE9A8E